MASQNDVRIFEYTLAVIAVFSAYVIYSDDPSGFGPFFVKGIAYFASLALIFSGLGLAKGRGRWTYLMLLVACTTSVMLWAYLSTAGNGTPIQGSQISYTCSNVQIPNATSPTGYTNGTKCIGNSYYDATSIVYNIAFWSPLMGAILYAMPIWIEPEKRNPVTVCMRNLIGSVPAGVTLLLTYGLYNLNLGFPELFNGHSPLNPFVSYNYSCSSVDFGMVRCVQVNVLYYFIDYLFWIAVVSVIALAAGGLASILMARFGRKNVSVVKAEELSP
ncbi:MAG: hypothetical protein JRN52_13310 [Nitrososphaerota archaeon]|nr:hypothetical protein [Nitrososphaerota archaeon]